MGQPPVVEQEIVLPVSPEELWTDLTDPAMVGCWFGATVEWELVPGGPARFEEGDGTERRGVVETVRPGRELRFRWWAPGEPASEVEYRLEPVDGGTRLTVVERGPAGDDEEPEHDAAAPQASMRWGTRMAGLWLAARQPVLA